MSRNRLPWSILTIATLIVLINTSQATKSVFRTLLNIYDEAFFKNSQWLKVVNYFRKNDPSSMFGRVLNTSLSKVIKYRSSQRASVKTWKK